MAKKRRSRAPAVTRVKSSPTVAGEAQSWRPRHVDALWCRPRTGHIHNLRYRCRSAATGRALRGVGEPRDSALLRGTTALLCSALSSGHGAGLQFASESRTRLRLLAAHFARALPGLSAFLVQEGAGKAGRRLAPAVCCAKGRKMGAQQHTGGPDIRPSLRDGLTAYAERPRGAMPFYPRRLAN